MQKRIELLEEQLKFQMNQAQDKCLFKPAQTVSPVANPSPLGLFGFAIVSWLAGITKIISGKNDSGVSLPAIFVGGVAQLIAGLMHFAKNNAHSATTFSLFGLHWIVRGVYMHALLSGTYQELSSHGADAAYYILLTVSTLLLWIPSLRMNKVLSTTLFVVASVFVLDAVSAFQIRGAEITAGLLSCIAATMAFYLCAADLVNETWERVILPVYPHQEHEADYHLFPYFPRIHFHKSVTASTHH